MGWYQKYAAHSILGIPGELIGWRARSIDKSKNYDDLPWYDRAAATIASKSESATRSIAGVVGMEDSIGTENNVILDTLKHTREDDAGSSFNTGTNVTAPSGSPSVSAQKGGIGVGGEVPSGGNSLGLKYALEDDPSLDQVNYNNNNFSF